MNSKQKGNRGELELLHLLQGRGLNAQRNQQRYIGGINNPDVRMILGNGMAYHIEVKRQERFNLHTALNQAIHDANGEATPAVCHRRNGEPWFITMRLDDFLMTMGGTE